MPNIQVTNYDGQGVNVTLDKLPDECPFCHKGITPRALGTGFFKDDVVQVSLLCTTLSCQSLFIAYYQGRNWPHVTLQGVSKGTHKAAQFSDSIQGISPAFVTIYQQADVAEQEQLFEICGVGYRKAIEFLVKDYAIKKHPTEQATIEKKFLGNCINDYIDNDKVKSVAKRATWLGNDETHYVRKWEGKNLSDLKTLIRLTIHWLEMEAETDRFEQEMPE